MSTFILYNIGIYTIPLTCACQSSHRWTTLNTSVNNVWNIFSLFNVIGKTHFECMSIPGVLKLTTCYQVTENVCWYKVKKGITSTLTCNFIQTSVSMKVLLSWSFLFFFNFLWCLDEQKKFRLFMNHIQSEKVKDWGQRCPLKCYI